MLFYHILRILQGVFFRISVQVAQRIEDSQKVYFLRIAVSAKKVLFRGQGKFYGTILWVQHHLK